MGGVFPLTVRVVTGGLDSVGHDVGNAYALNTVGAIVGSFLSGFVVLPAPRPPEGHLRRRARSTWRWRRCCSVAAPELTRRRRAGRRRRRRRAGAAGPGDSALGSGQLLVGLLPRVDRARVHLPQDPQARLEDPELVFYEDGMATTVTVDQLGQDLFAEEQRQGRRVERRRHADADHRRPAAVSVLQPATPAQGRAGRLRLGRHGRRDHAVPDRVAGGRRAGGGRLPRRRTSSTTTTTARCRTRRSPRASATAATS